MQIEKINHKECLIEKLWKISVIVPNFPLIRKMEIGNRFFLLDKHRQKRGIKRITFPCLMHPQLLLRGFSSFLKMFIMFIMINTLFGIEAILKLILISMRMNNTKVIGKKSFGSKIEFQVRAKLSLSVITVFYLIFTCI